jgi:hypothetical protein
MKHNGYKWTAFDRLSAEDVYSRLIDSYDRLFLVQVAIDNIDDDGILGGVHAVTQDGQDQHATCWC